MDKKMETTIIGYAGTTIRIHSFLPSSPPKASLRFRGWACRDYGVYRVCRVGFIGILIYMSYSLDSLNGIKWGDSIGEDYRGY